MFVLRKITSEGVEMNFNLGNAYTLVYGEVSPKEFKMYAEHEELDVASEGIYAFLSCDGGHRILPLYKDQKNYIMSSDGKTFENASCRL